MTHFGRLVVKFELQRSPGIIQEHELQKIKNGMRDRTSKLRKYKPMFKQRKVIEM